VTPKPFGQETVYKVDVRIFSDVTLEPGQSVTTSLTFVAAADARQLFLTGNTRSEPPFWVRLYFGSGDSLLRKRTLLRVL
jgi:hypothetical protein